MPRWTLFAASALAAVVAAPPTALAASVRVEGTTLVYEASSGEGNRPNIAVRDAGAKTYDVHDSVALQHGPGCVESDNPFSRPRHVICTVPNLTRIQATLGDGDDSFTTLSSVGAAVGTVVDLGPGMNSVTDQGNGISRITGGPGVDEIDSYGGDDVISSGGGSDDINSGDGNDEVRLGAGPEDYAFGGTGTDVLYGDEGVDSLRGSDGDDTLHGGAGNDNLAGEGGVDQLNGDEGNDELTDDASLDEFATGDVLRGGGGTDTANYASWRLGTKGSTLAISLDGQANDGQDDNQDGIAEEADNVGPDGDVEYVKSGSGDDTLVGSDRPERIDAGSGNDKVNGLGGDDELNADTGDDVVLGGGGNDDIEGSSNKDRLLGEAGNDSISGSTGDDAIDPGPGLDTVDAGDDNDAVLAADAEKDTIGCGIGADVAEVDSIDVVNADPGSLCESQRVTQVQQAGPGGGAPGGGGPGGGGGGGGVPITNPGNGNPNAVVFTAGAVPGQRLTGILRNGAFGYSATAPAAGTVRTVAQVDRGTARKARIAAKKYVTIGSGKATATAAGPVGIKVSLTKKARKGLRKAKRLQVRFVTTFTAPGQAPRTTTKTVTFKK